MKKDTVKIFEARKILRLTLNLQNSNQWQDKLIV